MDTISHGLWGGIAFGRATKRDYWAALGLGIAPDLLSFGLFSAMDILGIISGPDWTNGPPNPAAIPDYVHYLYNVTHSLIIFVAIFAAVWLIRRRPYLPLLAWGLHILMDIPTHSTTFFPTPFLWPVSDYRFNGIPWSHPYVFWPNLGLLVLAYGLFVRSKRKRPSTVAASSVKDTPSP